VRRLSSVVSLFLCGFLSAPVLADHMEEVVVSGSHEKRSIDVAEELTVVADTALLLKKAPGASVNSNGPLSGIPQYRGMFGPRIGVQLNGTQLAPAGPNWMDPPLSYAAAAQIQSLQLYRGIAPVSVVQESIGGAINAVSRRGDFIESDDMSLSGHLLASGQSVNQGAQAGATLIAANRQHRLLLAAMKESGEDAEFKGGDIIPTEYTRDRYDLAYGFRTGRHTLQVDYTRNETGDTGTPALPMDIQYIDGDLYSFGYDYAGNDWTLAAKVFGSDLHHGMTNYHLREAPTSNALWRRNLTDSDTLGFKLLATREDGSGSWILGADGIDASHDSDIDNPNNPVFFVVNFNNAQRRVLGIFTERQQDFGAGWTAEFGLRYNRVETDADEVNGTPAMIMPPAQMLRNAFNNADRSKTDDNVDAVAKVWYHSSDDLSFYAGVAQKTRSPAYQERYLWLPLQATGGLADGLTYTGNIELKPERAREVELGLDFADSGLIVSPRIFYREVDDYIQGTPSAVMPARMFVTMQATSSGVEPAAPLQFNNVDATLWGADMDWRYELDEHWALKGLLSYVRGERDDIDDNLYRIAPLNGTLALSYSGQSWGATMEVALFDQQAKVSATNNEQKSDSYGLLNFSSYWQVSTALRLAAGLDNALDEAYQDHLSGINRVRGNPDIATGERLYGNGRNLYLRLDYTF
jgi:iron complex outermembrane receptor protein